MRKYIPIIAIMAVALATGCTKASLQTTYDSQETKIESFINSQAAKGDTMRVVNNKGSHRAVIVEGTGDSLAVNGNVAFYYAGYTFSGTISSSNLFATNKADVASAAKLPLDDADAVPLTITLDEADILEGLRNGLEGVKAGEECYILFSGKYGFGKHMFGTIPANSALAYHIWVESIGND